ncbi:MAG TPA: DUF2950 domain-containing protein [Thermoanaerobaculaceae bacterium]|nr:DUF2950 domain-containing protein [Thermoanaerobaculaceae bacterium]
MRRPFSVLVGRSASRSPILAGARAAAAIAVVAGCGLALAPAVAAAKPPKQATFATPDAAVQALVKATAAADQKALAAIFGPDREKLLSGDPVEDANALKAFSERLAKAATVEKVDDAKYTLLVGEERWPSPIPIVKAGKKWRFDTEAGLDEILNRRVGRNELSAIMTCRAYVVAQWEYFTEARDTATDAIAVYAQHFISKPGLHDGLYWDVPEGGKPSPLGSLVAAAREEGYTPGAAKPADQPHRTPYQGYFFRILKAQGPHAPGGRFSYVINGNMIAGYALIAYPAKWGVSGVMTFIVNNQGRVYEKNLGEQTEELARAVTEYDPDPSWRLVDEP